MNKSILTEIVGLKETIFIWALKGVGNITKNPNAPSPKFSLIFFFLNFCIKQSMNNKMHQNRNEDKRKMETSKEQTKFVKKSS